MYGSFLTTVKQFSDLDALPVPVNFKDETPEKFMENKGKWHKSCHLKFALSKLGKEKEERDV